MITAEPSALAATVAQRLIHFRYRYGHDVASRFPAAQKEMGVGLLNVAVQQEDPSTDGSRQIDGYRGLAGAAFARSNCNSHDQCPSTSADFMVGNAPARYASRASATVAAWVE